MQLWQNCHTKLLPHQRLHSEMVLQNDPIMPCSVDKNYCLKQIVKLYFKSAFNRPSYEEQRLTHAIWPMLLMLILSALHQVLAVYQHFEIHDNLNLQTRDTPPLYCLQCI